MKFLSAKEMNKIAKVTLALVLAGSFTFSSTLASAAEKTDHTEKYETIVLDNQTLKNTSKTDDKENAQFDQDQQQEATKEEKPSLVPGNFFYFAKIAIEKIKLALTFDDKKEAKLLAEYAAERLAESEALFADGKEDQAVEVIDKALETLTKAEDKTVNNHQKGTAKDEPTVEETENKEQNGEKIAVTEETSKDKDNADDEVTVDQPADEMEGLISQNIIALKAALEKVKNPVAKAALQKNIDKSYARLAKKLEKLNHKHELKKEAELATKEEVSDEQVSKEDNQDDVTVNTDKTSQVAVKKDEEAVSPEKTKHENADKLKLMKNTAKAEIKQTREVAKKQIKQQRVEAKEERKQQHEAVKQEAKQARQEAKQAREEVKHQRKVMKVEASIKQDVKHNENKGHHKGQNNQANGENNQ
ncbi:DUF5667 domain-containing protein [Bacillus sp. S/N-304-OC-R1]|uniref:DUF5667 domain-containing protein n=1 Tax=Bacillus sp. S/N-304-OC-R1 TaxID=2758034 RepID=UPI001C8DE356|nr:DUF5667 domain-containing protein [Bacillus sp. S/N-304-OC-R1]MBY0120952.1 hypothetical protein [Bacillus sp. S/N-304-OC-R1]